MDAEARADLEDFVMGLGRFAWTGRYCHTHPQFPGGAALHEVCLDLEKRGLVTRGPTSTDAHFTWTRTNNDLLIRNDALCHLSLRWARRNAEPYLRPGEKMPPDDVLLISMHKARYDIPSIPRELRLESAEWLRARGYGAYKVSLLPPGELPE